MTNHIDRREQQLLAKLQTTEDQIHRMDRKTTTERQNHRQYIEKTLKGLEDWEENLLQREQTMDRNKSNPQAQYDRYTRKYDILQQQTERAITAWQEIAQTTLKEKIDIKIREQTVKIKDFAMDQEQKLISHLDGYEEDAGGIQAKLLTRLHTDIKQTYTETQEECRQNDAIPVDEDNIPSTSPDQPMTQPSLSAPASVPPKASRWINVDHNDIMKGHTPSQDKQAVLHPEMTSTPSDAPASDSPPKKPDTNKYPAADYQQLARLRAATTPNQLRGRDRKSICIFYNLFVDFNRIYRIPLKILDDIRLDKLDDEAENVYPTGLREQAPQLYDDYSSAIYARLEEDGVLDPHDPLYK